MYLQHPNYNGNGDGYPNDIALLELSSSLQLGTNTVDKIRLAQPRDGDMAGQRCWLSGWGRTSGGMLKYIIHNTYSVNIKRNFRVNRTSDTKIPKIV